MSIPKPKKTQKQVKVESVKWTEVERLAWKPPKDMTVSQWADKERILDRSVSPEPGPWRTDRVPYTKEPMDAFTDPAIEKIVLIWGTQSAKTSVIENCVGYLISEDPGPTMAVYPSADLAEHISEQRFSPMFRSTKQIREKWLEGKSKKLEVQFSDMYFALVGSNSPSQLAARPIRYLLMDETDKFPVNSGSEANPLKLATERTKNFHDRKIIEASTPTTREKHIWKELEGADILKRYYVPCPHCSAYQTLKFSMNAKEVKGGVKWLGGKDADPNVVRENSWYECEKCGKAIRDRDKQEMLDKGQWRDEKETPPYLARSVAYHLNSIYSPWVTFGDVAHEFLKTRNDPSEFQNFINSWLAEPWEEKAVSFKSDSVLLRQADHEFGEVPEEAAFLTMGVDVQMDHFFWVVRAWAEGLTSWNISHGRCETWGEVEEILYQTWSSKNGAQYVVAQACIDAGFRTDDVYQFCTTNPIALPTKGASNPMRAPYSRTKVDKSFFKNAGLELLMQDHNYWKDFISGRVNRENGRGSWMVYKGTDETLPFLRDYADQICAEQKVHRKNSKGATVTVWTPIGSNTPNHYLDCEVNAALAAEVAGVRFLRKNDVEAEPIKEEKKPNNWLGNSGGFGAGKGWLSR